MRKKLLVTMILLVGMVTFHKQMAMAQSIGVARPELLRLSPDEPIPEKYLLKADFSINEPKHSWKNQRTSAAWDCGVVSSPSPAGFVALNQVLTISCIFKNYGTSTVTGVNLNYKWRNNPVETQAWTGSLGAGATSGTVTFGVTVPAYNQGVNTLRIWTNSPNGNTDALATNDTLIVLCYVDDPASTSTATSISGRDFYTGFMHNWDNGYIGCGGALGSPCQKLYQRLIFATLGNASTVTVTAPLANAAYTRTKTIAAYSVDTIVVPNTVGGIRMSTEISKTETVSKTGIHVTATKDINLYTLSEERYTTDGSIALPVGAMGTDYIVTCPAGISNPVNPAAFLIVAGEDGLQCTIKNKMATPSRAANTTWTTPVLNKGNTYLVVAKQGTTLATNGDLTGSTITSNGKKYSVVEGSTGPLIPAQYSAGQCNYVNAVFEQSMPVNTWGKDFYSTEFANKSGIDIVRVVSSDPGTTTYSFNGTNFTLVGTGVYRDHNISASYYVTADKPVAVKQMSTGGGGSPAACVNAGAGATNGDPFIMTIIPQTHWADYYVFTTPPSNFPQNYVNIIKKGSYTTVAIDGLELSNTLFTQIGTTGYYVAQYAIAIGDHVLIANNAFTAYVYGFAADDSYGYPASGASLVGVPLPVELLHFGANLVGNAVNLNWVTASEKNNSHFIVERSVDGIKFESIGTVTGSGNSSTTHSYSLKDERPIVGVNYYRLKQVDFDGKSEYSKIVSIDISKFVNDIFVAPVPSSDNVKVKFNSVISGAAEMDIYDMMGRKVKHFAAQEISEGTNEINVDINDLNKGVYFLYIVSPLGVSAKAKIARE